ncbi:hypothetical protein L2E82_39181 [Cichorium intybus]|uniref:Uncharacterized protein n=1 Tax=Cichorium intybus TaxID=13427 RepID=A0ACB9AIG9_CICIN|nr:hypothetical protein L2E82_39181 [Cichorium intybus]
MDKFNSSSATSGSQAVESSSNTAQIPNSSATPQPENHIPSSGDRSRAKHHLSMSMDASEMLTSGPEESSSIDAKKSMSAAKLAELALLQNIAPYDHQKNHFIKSRSFSYEEIRVVTVYDLDLKEVKEEEHLELFEEIEGLLKNGRSMDIGSGTPSGSDGGQNPDLVEYLSDLTS